MRVAAFISTCLVCGSSAYASIEQVRKHSRKLNSHVASSALANLLFATSPSFRGISQPSPRTTLAKRKGKSQMQIDDDFVDSVEVVHHDDCEEMLINDGYNYLDVRDPNELTGLDKKPRWDPVGPVQGAWYNVPTYFPDFQEDLFVANVTKLFPDKATGIIVGCAKGLRQKPAAEALVRAGYTNVKQIEGGFMSWLAHRLPSDFCKGKFGYRPRPDLRVWKTPKPLDTSGRLLKGAAGTGPPNPE